MEGTRQDILAAISSWVDDLNAPNILWLKGYPGVGKSAVASSVVERLRLLMRLGSSFFFRRDNANDMTPNALWRVVAYDLARQYSPIKEKIVAALKVDEAIPTTVNVDKLFCQLILNPIIASENMIKGALPVIVIDGLDECGGLDGQYSEHRKSLLQTLKNWSRLSSSFKLLVTSRDESDINQCFSTTSHQLVEIPAGISVEAQTSVDIATFLEYRFQKIARKYPKSLSLDWPGRQVIQELTAMAQGLFIWVIVITNLADRGDPEERLSQILRGGGASGMARLYSLLLNTSFPDQSGDFTTCFRSILGAVILAKVPLEILSLTHLLSVKATTIEHICNGLQAVMDSKNTLRIYHQSFVDFLIDKSQCPSRFLIDRHRESHTLTTACLRTMKDHLRFNICNLETSYLRNNDIQDLATRITACVSPQLAYASCFWASHLADTPFDPKIVVHLEEFMDNQFLYWLEVLSLIKRVNIASGMLWILIEYLQPGGHTKAMARDMQKFVATFRSLISYSLPHIYLSALPFAPRNSAVSRKYTKDYSQTLRVQKGGFSQWPATQNVLVGHSDRVKTASFSQDGRWIASGSADRTIRVWDAETGEMVAGPLKGHNGSVNSVAFSPDGRRIVSGSSDNTIRIWDAESGETIIGPLKRHSKPVNSVAFSRDGRRVVSASSDFTIRLWNADTGKVIKVLVGHDSHILTVDFSPKGEWIVSGSKDGTILLWEVESAKVTREASRETIQKQVWGRRGSVHAISFSPDGRRVVSGSLYGTIRVWDAETGEMITESPKEHTDAVNSVKFSPDGRRVISGSEDSTIRVWDAETGEMITESPKEHTDAVNSVKFSPDGRRIVSGSDDKTLRVWDAETGKVVAGPLKGHTDFVNSVCFSPNDKWIVSGSDDTTLLIWDAETGEVVAGPLKGHKGPVLSVGYSPDGRKIVSASSDRIIVVWDAVTGKVVTGPLKGHNNRIRSVCFSPNEKWIVSGSDDGFIRVWDAKTGEVVGPLKGHNHCVISVGYSPDGRQIVSSSYDGAIKVWDAATGKVVRGLLKGHNECVRSVCFSPNEKWIVSGSDDGSILVWDAKTGEIVGPLKSILVWDTKPDMGKWRWIERGGRVMSVTFSLDGRKLASGSSDGTVRVWDLGIDDTISSTGLIATNTSEEKDGWVLGPKSELLFWVPHELRKGLCLPGRMVLASPFPITELDFSAFVHGESWIQCKDDRMACDSGMA
ncbi:hypothetical protein M408DRAFT_226597 [Serendipita vermifera MAFF 305830]|uniref:Uncharacterized protein n=1 Tax=Serendipita vermifera MAFF 305830 TaxID=933852 RepID=A0A0C3AKE6_SERVB|nr:hypothetical protein M408DRAFT_226597 [Serendipita vermifera MAFF 305830]